MTSLGISRPASCASALRQAAGFLLGSATVLGLIGPFGTMPEMALPARLAHWILTGAAIGLLSFSGLMAVRRLRRPKSTPLWMTMLVAAAVSAPGASIVEASLRIGSPAALDHVGWTQLFGQCLLLNQVLTLLAWGLFRPFLAPQAGSAHKPQAASVAASQHGPLADRLPAALRGARILALTAEDHYLRVRTDRGDALLHMRIADAEALLIASDGLRVHRSHWVSRAAVDGIARQGGQWRILLQNGVSVPVARSRIERLRQAGWLAGLRLSCGHVGHVGNDRLQPERIHLGPLFAGPSSPSRAVKA